MHGERCERQRNKVSGHWVDGKADRCTGDPGVSSCCSASFQANERHDSISVCRSELALVKVGGRDQLGGYC